MNTNHMPRPEYPRPQLVREDWINLNGTWEFEMDFGRTGRERELHQSEGLQQSIIVPFCPESELSGIGYTDFMPAVWYRKTFTLPQDWAGKRIVLHFGAVDYEAEVWVNGVSAGTHRGGYSSFQFDITKLVREGENVITVYAEDDVRTGLQPGGKQSGKYHSYNCYYTRTTGIWQTVWLECVSDFHIDSYRIVTDPANGQANLAIRFKGSYRKGLALKIDAFYDGKPVGSRTAQISSHQLHTQVSLNEVHLWEPGHGRLYDLRFTLEADGQAVDTVTSYFGMREIALTDKAVLINGRTVFQRLVLDQGFYPDGIYTAPTDEALRRDIELAMDLGFNGARLHEKIFEPRFLYWADKLGYLVWAEHANWGLDITTPMGLRSFLPEWLEGMERDFNHPSIIGWCPFNETWDRDGRKQDNEVLRITYEVSKSVDPTRPVKDTSGHYHVKTDIFSVHDYDQNPESFAARLEPMKNGGEVYVKHPKRQKYEGQPYQVAEYGGIWWDPAQSHEEGWGYGDRPKSEEEFLVRYEGLMTAILDNPNISGLCYTQLYDVEQEVNGLYTYDRKLKFSREIIRRINLKPAAIEQAELQPND